MTRTSKELLALTLGFGLALAACGKAKPPLQTPTVAFLFPTDGETLTADAGMASNGILSINVAAKTTNVSDGSKATLSIDGSVTASATVEAGGLVFANVALPGSDPATTHILKIVVQDSGGNGNATASITVSVFLPSLGHCNITIAPADDSLFNETGNAVQGHNTVKDQDLTTSGMQANLTVTVGAPCPDGPVTLIFGDGGGTQPAPVTSVSGVATFTGITLPETTAAALSDTTKLLAVTASAGTGTEASSDTIHYVVDSIDPVCTITAPANGATISLADDIDPNTAGIQVNVTGTCQGLAGTTPGISIADATGSLGMGPVNADGTFSIEVTLAVGTEVLTLSGTSLTGNPITSNTNTVTVSNTCPTPTLTLNAPTANEIFNLGNSLSAGTGELQVVFHMTTNAPGSDTIEVCSTVAPTAGAATCGFGTGTFEVGTTSPSNGNASLTAALGDDGAAASQTLTAQVTDPCGTMQATVAVAVHALQPVIDSIAFSNAFIDSDGGIWLNATTLQAGGAATTVTLTVDGADMFGDGGAAITLNGSLVGTAAFTGTGSPTAQVQLSNLADGTYAFDATATDIWGNLSDPKQTLPVAVSFPLYVKTSLPTCTITAPDPATRCFNVADNDGDAGSGAVEVPILVTATNASALDINGLAIDGTATVKTGGGGLTSDPIATAAISVFATSSQGANAYSATVTDPAGNTPAACTPASLNVNVSTVAPTFTITPQNAGAADANGCVTYTTRDGIVIDVATTDIANGTAISIQAIGPNGGGTAKTPATVTNGAASVTLNGLPNGDDTLIVSGTDSCENSAINNTVCIGVTAPGCDLSLVAPVPTATDAGESVVFNASQVDTNGNATIELHTSCAAGTQVQFDSTPSGGSDQPQDGGVDANGNVTFDLGSLVDGSTGTFTSGISGGEVLPTISYDAKLSLPAITSETPVAGTLEIVANQDNLILSDAGVTSLAVTGGTIIANEAQCTVTSCADFTIAGISGLGPVDGNGNVGMATLTLSFPGFSPTNPSPITIANGTTTVTFSAVSMPPVATGTVTLTLSDNAGNSTSETWNVNADGIQPPAPSGLTAAMSDKRTASVLLSWTVPAAGSASATQGYELAYVINNLNATVPTTPSESTYAGWTLDPGVASVNGAAGANLTYTEKNLPTLNQYTFELRAIDAVGNRSTLTAAVTAVGVSAADPNAWQMVTITDTANDAADSDFGYVLRNGDFNNDGMQDLVITAPYQYAANPTPGIVYILNGAADLSTATFGGLTSISLGGTAFDWFGQDAHVADYNGDGIDDLAIGSPEYNNGQGRVDIFFGSKPGGLPASPSTTILGDGTSSGLFGYSVGAVDVNGDKIPDLLVGAPGMGASGNGASYLFLGSKAAWPNPDAGADVTSATSVITGNAGDGLGARWGSVAIGDIDGDGDGDFTVSAPGGGGTDGFDAGPGSVYGFSGKTALANATMTVGANALFTLAGPGSGFCDPIHYGYASGDGDEAFTLWTCFGDNAISANFTNPQGLPDLVVGSDYESEAFLFNMTKTGPTTPPSHTFLDFNEALGWSMIAPDLNMDGRPDLLMGENNGLPNVYLYLNIDGGFPSPVPPIGGDSNGQSGEVFGGAGTAFGYGLASGDFQGISKPDFAISDWDSFDVIVYY